jgi:hypothetical protein
LAVGKNSWRGKGGSAIEAHLAVFGSAGLERREKVSSIIDLMDFGRRTGMVERRNWKTHIPPVWVLTVELDQHVAELLGVFGDILGVELGEVDGDVGLERHCGCIVV